MNKRLLILHHFTGSKKRWIKMGRVSGKRANLQRYATLTRVRANRDEIGTIDDVNCKSGENNRFCRAFFSPPCDFSHRTNDAGTYGIIMYYIPPPPSPSSQFTWDKFRSLCLHACLSACLSFFLRWLFCSHSKQHSSSAAAAAHLAFSHRRTTGDLDTAACS
jgi:hypothetical protein